MVADAELHEEEGEDDGGRRRGEPAASAGAGAASAGRVCCLCWRRRLRRDASDLGAVEEMQRAAAWEMKRRESPEASDKNISSKAPTHKLGAKVKKKK